MTEIQRTNIEVCNRIIAQLGQDKPFNVELGDISESFWSVLVESDTGVMHIPSKDGKSIEIHDGNFDQIYHAISSYIAKHDLPESVVESLGEVS